MRGVTGERSVLIIFDRNYVSLEFLNYLEGCGIKYLIRLHKGDYKAETGKMEGEEVWGGRRRADNKCEGRDRGTGDTGTVPGEVGDREEIPHVEEQQVYMWSRIFWRRW
jgi:hypothetical protein